MRKTFHIQGNFLKMLIKKMHNVRAVELLGAKWGLSGKQSACNSGDTGPIPRLGRSPGGGHGNPLQYSCLENPMERGAWWATVHRMAKTGAHLK